MEAELRAYRANPTDRRFADVYRVASPWLKSTGISTIRTYRGLTVSGALDDVALEGALSLSRSARRFVYFCETCGRAFVHSRDLSAHSMSEHRRRGVAALVSLSTFSQTSARLAMKRTARRLVRPEILEPDVETGIDYDAESNVLMAVLVSRLRERLSARALAELEAILLRDVPAPEEVAEELRRELTHLG
jgi:hypothetical protein